MSTELALSTIPRVPLVKTGSYDLMSGPVVFTETHLLAAVAATRDPAVRAPVLKFGHEEQQLTQQPSIGRVTNLDYDPETQTLYGDFEGVPDWLARIMPIAYPDRSVEGWTEFVSATGRKHPFVLMAVSLLGEDPPGVSTLEDLYELFYGAPVAASGEGIKVVIKGASMGEIAATLDVEDVRRQFYETLGPGQEWWWIRSVRLDPDELIVDDDEGHLYRVPFTIDGDSTTFGKPILVRIEYTDVAATLASSKSKPVAVYETRASSRPGSDNANELEDTMDSKAIAKALGLGEDASQDEILSKINELSAEEAAAPKTEPKEDPVPTVPDTRPEPEPKPEESDSTFAVPDGMVLVDADKLRELTVAASAGVKAYERQQDEDRDRALDEAIRAGKFPRSRKEHYASLWKADPAGTKGFIDKLEGGVIPVSESGTSIEAGATEEEAYPAAWLPELAGKRNHTNARVSGEEI